MRGPIGLCLTLWFASGIDAAENSFPYAVRIAVDETYLRSGPATEYYATLRLENGAELEVYRRDPTGWLAVRPPAGSFSWVAASSLRLTEGGATAAVVGPRVVSWVGSELGEVQDRKWQVELKPGERLEVLGRQSMEIYQGAEVETFFKIAPPAGEFRWIDERVVRPAKVAADGDGGESTVRLADFRVATRESAARSSGDGFVARKDTARLDESGQVAGSKAVERVALLDPVAGTANKGLVLSGADIQRQVKEIDLRLALEVAQPPLSWDLAQLRQEIGSLTARAESTLARARARRVQDKVEEFEALQHRYLGLEEGGDPSDRTPAAKDDALTARRDSDAVYDPRFDGQGWLLPVHSKKLESPPYALLDSKGAILQFVSPAPGLNLHRYLRQEIGIFGQKGRFLGKPHLTAHRIIDLNRHRR